MDYVVRIELLALIRMKFYKHLLVTLLLVSIIVLFDTLKYFDKDYTLLANLGTVVASITTFFLFKLSFSETKLTKILLGLNILLTQSLTIYLLNNSDFFLVEVRNNQIRNLSFNIIPYLLLLSGLPILIGALVGKPKNRALRTTITITISLISIIILTGGLSFRRHIYIEKTEKERQSLTEEEMIEHNLYQIVYHPTDSLSTSLTTKSIPSIYGYGEVYKDISFWGGSKYINHDYVQIRFPNIYLSDSIYIKISPIDKPITALRDYISEDYLISYDDLPVCGEQDQNSNCFTPADRIECTAFKIHRYQKYR